MAGEGYPVDVGGAGVQDVEEQALALLDADGFTEAEHLAVDGGDVVGGGHVAVVAALELAVPVMEREKGFGVVGARVVGGFDEERAVESVEEAFGEVVSRVDVGVIPAEAGGVRGESVVGLDAGSDHGRAFFHGTVDIGGKEEAVPVEDLGVRGVVADGDGGGPAVAHADEGTGDLVVVGEGADVVLG